MADRVQCPRCQAWTPLEPNWVEGEVIRDRGAGVTDRIQATYPLAPPRRPRPLIVDCGGCGNLFFALEDYSGGKAVWPLAVPACPEDIQEKVAEAYKDARLAFAAGSKIGALLAGRTTLIRLLRDKKASQFKDLIDRNIITPALYGGADQLRLWASMVGHDDVPVDALDEKDVEDILDYLATMLESVYTHQAKVDRFASRTKELKEKRSTPK